MAPAFTSLGRFPMITCNQHEISIVNITSLSPGDLFTYAEPGRKFTAVVVDHTNEPRYISWLHLTGPHRFMMEGLHGPCSTVRDGKVLRLAMRLGALRLQIAESGISHKPQSTIGALFIDEHPRIVTAFLPGDGSDQEADLWALSLHDLSRHRLGHGYACDEWRLLNVPAGQPPEVVAEFSPPAQATAEPLRT
ncbi:MAG TPA: hypothetical protein VJ862_09260 [Rhodanobacteraceae bacterium]|nr:hypothetical protein [Rhodanobacteraceae bacterium]